MANFDSPKAAGRDLSQPKTPGIKSNDSTQIQTTGAGNKAGPMPAPANGDSFINSTQRQFSNQLQFGANAKGTGTIKDALNSYKQKMITNPPTGDMSGNRKAAGKTNGVNL